MWTDTEKLRVMGSDLNRCLLWIFEWYHAIYLGYELGDLIPRCFIAALSATCRWQVSIVNGTMTEILSLKRRSPWCLWLGVWVWKYKWTHLHLCIKGSKWSLKNCGWASCTYICQNLGILKYYESHFSVNLSILKLDFMLC